MKNIHTLATLFLTTSALVAQATSGSRLIQAELADESSEVNIVPAVDAYGFSDGGDYLAFEDFQLPSSFDTIELSYAIDDAFFREDTRIVFSIGSPRGLDLAFLQPSETGSWTNYELQQFNAGALDVYAGATVDLYIRFEGRNALGNLDAFRFLDSQSGEASDFVEAESADTAKGLRLLDTASGYVEDLSAGDFLRFDDVFIPETSETIRFNLAVDPTDSSPDDRIVLTLGGPAGLRLAFLQPEATKSGLDFQQQTFNIGALSAYAGQEIDLYLTFEGSGIVASIESFELLDDRIEAESFSSQQGTRLTNGGTAVGYINAGDVLGFNDVFVPEGTSKIEISLAVPASQADANDRIVVTLFGEGGLRVLFLQPSPTGGWRDFETQTFDAGIIDVLAGGSLADVFFNFEGNGFIVDIDSFRFVTE